MKAKRAAKSGRAGSAVLWRGSFGQPGRLELKSVLVPVDFSDCSLRALDYAVMLAGRLEAKLTLLHVVEPVAVPERGVALSPVLDEENQRLLAASRERLSGLREQRVGQRVVSDSLVRMGRVHSEIPDTAKALGAGLIVMGTQGQTGPGRLLGSTAERVIRDAPCPVLTVRQE